MVMKSDNTCPDCGGRLRYFDKTLRIVRTKNRKSKWIKIKRLKCTECGKIHRELPLFIFPYKQYEVEVIRGVLEGYITTDTLGFEDSPCELTMKKWLASQKLQGLL